MDFDETTNLSITNVKLVHKPLAHIQTFIKLKSTKFANLSTVVFLTSLFTVWYVNLVNAQKTYP